MLGPTAAAAVHRTATMQATGTCHGLKLMLLLLQLVVTRVETAAAAFDAT